jgi:putative transposase
VVIDVYSRMVLGFSIYLEKPSAFTVGMAIAHAILPKENSLAGVGVQAEWPCWGKMRTIHCDNAKDFRGTVIGRACQDHDITIEHRPPREPRYGGHIERGFGTRLALTRSPSIGLVVLKLPSQRCKKEQLPEPKREYMLAILMIFP